MQDAWSADKSSVAYHEAGHLVIAVRVGAPAKGISLKWNEDEQVWHGDVADVRNTGVNPKLLIKIAYAGPWAEIKYQAREQLSPDARFDEHDQPTALIKHARDPDDDDMSSNPHPPVRFICADGQTKDLWIDLNAFSMDDGIAVHLARGDNALLTALLLETRDQLNDPVVWSAVEKLAMELLRRLGDGREVNIPAAEVEALIQGTLAKPGA